MIRRRRWLGWAGALGCSASAAPAGPGSGSGSVNSANGGSSTAAQPPQPFEFVALGDMPYGPDAIAGPAYRHLISLINQAAPRFAIHVGDFKDGAGTCDDEAYALQQRHFQRFEGALIYTPGDNDWTDCQRRGNDPLERLQALRQRFFATPQSLGQQPLALQRQGDLMPAFARYAENARWWHQGVLFATFHTVGLNNAVDADQAPVRAEALVREAANAAWIAAAFALARSQGARALVLATQAGMLAYRDPHAPERGSVRKGFEASVTRTLLPLAEAAPHPVLLINGDYHDYATGQPFFNAAGQRIHNLWRLQVFGEPRIHAVRVRVDAGLPGRAGTVPFSFTPIWNPLSPDPRGPRG